MTDKSTWSHNLCLDRRT